MVRIFSLLFLFNRLKLFTINFAFFNFEGVVVDKITTFYKFERKYPFIRFADETINARRAADNGTGSEVKGTIQKLKGNSGYGEFTFY